jgi:hypothetical protein
MEFRRALIMAAAMAVAAISGACPSDAITIEDVAASYCARVARCDGFNSTQNCESVYVRAAELSGQHLGPPDVAAKCIDDLESLACNETPACAGVLR